MLSASLRWGAISGGVMLAAAALSFVFIGRLDASTYGIAEIAGYASIILGLAVIWLAVARRFSGEAASAEEAETVLNTGAAVDLVVTDIEMPGARNGLDLAKFVRAFRPHIRVVVVSSSPPSS